MSGPNHTDEDPRDRVESLIGKVEEQEELYRKLNAVSCAQIAELDGDAGPELEILGEKKRRVLAEIERADAEIRAAYRECEPHLDKMSDMVRLKLEVTRLRAAEALKVAKATEERGGERARVRLDKIGRDLAEVKRGQRIAKKYKPAVQDEDEPKFIDERQ
jgi:hypothetical protein